MSDKHQQPMSFEEAVAANRADEINSNRANLAIAYNDLGAFIDDLQMAIDAAKKLQKEIVEAANGRPRLEKVKALYAAARGLKVEMASR